MICGPGTLYGEDEPFCPDCLDELAAYEAPVAAPTPAVDPGTDSGARPAVLSWDRSRCWSCGTASPNPAANTECLKPGCHRSLTPPAVLLEFPGGEVEVGWGGSVELGRLGANASVFRNHPNVSRHHARIGAEPDGTVWIEPFTTPNGTFLDGTEIYTRQRLRTGHRVRLARNVDGEARVYAREDTAP
jgi:hypothetical protein